ncbi:MAG: Crp/Fnr family transcriptional regulator [Bacteroidia bacterium]
MSVISNLLELLDKNKIWDKEITVKRNHMIKSKGSIDDNIYFVLEGSCRLFIQDGDEEICVRLAYKDNFILALDSFFSNSNSGFCIQTIKKSKLKVLNKQRFEAFLALEPSRMKLWQGVLENIILQQIEREKDLLCSSPMERYQRVLQRSPQLFQEIPKKYIASYLRMTPETLSRIKILE